MKEKNKECKKERKKERLRLPLPSAALNYATPHFWVSMESCFPATPGAYKLPLSGMLQQESA
eukprot:693508-Pelagomonas_calceolata.AAC.1